MSIHEHFVGPMGGVLMAIIAFSIVFLVIVGLMMIMIGTKHLANMVDAAADKQKQAASQKASTSTRSAPVAFVPAVVNVSAAADNTELIAVITAAVTAIAGAAVRVTGIKIAPQKAASWKMTGRLDNLEGFA